MKAVSTFFKKGKSFDSLNFSKSEEISIFHSLKILDALQYEKNEKLFKLLSCEYLFFEDNVNYEGMISELQYSFKYSKEILHFK